MNLLLLHCSIAPVKGFFNMTHELSTDILLLVLKAFYFGYFMRRVEGDEELAEISLMIAKKIFKETGLIIDDDNENLKYAKKIASDMEQSLKADNMDHLQQPFKKGECKLYE